MAFNLRKAGGGLLSSMTQQDPNNEDPLGMGGLLGGMLGRRRGDQTSPTGLPELPQSAPAPDAAPATPASFWEGGSKFGWRDAAAGALATIGDAFAQQNGQQGFATPMLMQGRTAKFAADKAVRDAAVKRENEFQDWQRKEQWRRDNPEETYGTFQDNAGNQWRYNKLTGRAEDSPMFTDPNDRQFVADGQLIRVPNAVRGQQQANPSAPVGRLTIDPSPGAGQASAPQASEIPMLSQDQWRAAVEALGTDGAENWRRRNNIQIGGR